MSEGHNSSGDVAAGAQPRRAEARVGFAVITSPYLDEQRLPTVDDLVGALLQALAAGTTISRYGRLWRMAKPHPQDERWIHGRIGYERAGEQVELWDEDAQDFRITQLPAGRTSPFALDLFTRLVAFQLRPRDIKPQTFVGAFQALLQEAEPQMQWRVEHMFHEVAWDEFVSRVRLVHLRIRMQRPNPRYPGQRVETLVEGTGARVLDLAVQVPVEDTGELDPTDDLIQQAIEHADNDYGSYAAVGETLVGRLRRMIRWRSYGRGVALEDTAPVEEATSEVTGEDLQERATRAWTETPFFAEQAAQRGAIEPADMHQLHGTSREQDEIAADALEPTKPPPPTPPDDYTHQGGEQPAEGEDGEDRLEEPMFEEDEIDEGSRGDEA